MAASPKPSQLPPCGTELPETTADGEPEPATVIEPSPSGATELMIAPEPQVSDLVQKPAAKVTVEAAVEIMEAMESPTHCTTAEGEQELGLGDLIDFHAEIPILLCSPELLNWENIPPNLPLPPPLIDLFPSSTPSPLDPVSPSAHPQLTICSVGSTPLASSLEDSLTAPPASEAQTLPWSCNPAAPPWLPAPSFPPEPVSPPAPPGSLIPPAPPWSLVPLPPPRDCTPPAAPRRFVPPVLLGSSFPPASPQFSVAPAPPKPPAPPWPSGSLASPWLVGSPSPPRAPPPPAPPLSVGPLESSALLPSWLLPLSAPPWAVTMIVAWALPDSSCTWSFRNPPWLLPLSKPPWSSAGRPICPSPASRPPSEPPPSLPPSLPPFTDGPSTAQGRAYREGEN
ncbi:hypothetical protein M9458_015622, partial [Cirrhinus mrigala]